jgi:hypothetical protein
MTCPLRPVGVEPGREKHRGGLQDLVRAPQLEHLFAQRLDLLALLRGRQIRSQATIGLSLAHVLSQRLVVNPEISRHVTDRTTRLDRQPHTALDQLIGNTSVVVASLEGLLTRGQIVLDSKPP